MALDAAAGEPRLFLSTLPPGPADRRRAAASVVAIALVFAVAAPLAKLPLRPVWGFIPSYQAALAMGDLITAVLLLTQFTILRSTGLLALALGYLFTALTAVAHTLSFPGLFAPGGLLGAGPQTTAWLYMAWHGGFPLAVIAYALVRRGDDEPRRKPRRPRAAIFAGVALVGLTVCGLTLLATAGCDMLPVLLSGNRYTRAMHATVGTVWLLALAALVLLWRRRPHSVLDLWLMVVMIAWLCDIGLSAVLNSGRFDLGFYTGRIFGLIAASFVLIVLLLETSALYARLADTYEQQTAERDRRLNELRQELIHVARLNELGQMVSGLAHELNQPITAAGTYLAAAQAQAERGDDARTGELLSRAAAQIERTAEVIERLRQMVKKGEVVRRPDDLSAAVKEAVALVLAGEPSSGLNLQLLIAGALPLVLIDRVQIQQVLLNLLRNGLEAMAESGGRDMVIRAAPAADGTVEVSVTDSGPGLAPAVRERLFQPFVTTKDTGMGVGLSICRSIIEAHGGAIWASENPAGGAVFHFTVPCAPETDAREAMGSSAAVAAAATAATVATA